MNTRTALPDFVSWMIFQTFSTLELTQEGAAGLLRVAYDIQNGELDPEHLADLTDRFVEYPPEEPHADHLVRGIAADFLAALDLTPLGALALLQYALRIRRGAAEPNISYALDFPDGGEGGREAASRPLASEEGAGGPAFASALPTGIRPASGGTWRIDPDIFTVIERRRLGAHDDWLVVPKVPR